MPARQAQVMDPTALVQVQNSSPTYQIYRNKAKSLREKGFCTSHAVGTRNGCFTAAGEALLASLAVSEGAL